MRLVALSCHQGDVKPLADLLQFIFDLGGCKGYETLICADAATQFSDVLECKKLAEKSFDKVWLVSTTQPVTGWINGANAMFRTAADWIHRNRHQPFLWMEPDCAPLMQGWLDRITSEYIQCGRRYMGHIYEGAIPPTIPKRMMSGVAVYPGNAITELPFVHGIPWAWDMQGGEFMANNGAHTGLIKHLWGEKDNPPVFAEKSVPGTSVFSLDQIPPEAVLWHRCKNGSLIRLLRKKLGLTAIPGREPFVTVLPFFNRDAQLALKNMLWQRELGGCSKYDCLLSFEANTDPKVAAKIQAAASDTYKNVFTLKYQPASMSAWPYGPNWAFQHTAMQMYDLGRSWLWMETDMFALTPDWMQKLQDEYARCGKAFMGHVVKDFGHLQGTSIYPFDLPARCPKIMTATNIAFDTVSKEEILRDCHAANGLFCHIWGLHGDTPHHFTGIPIHFANVSQVNRWIPKEAVTMHRCKDGSIVDRLKEMRA